MVEQHKGSHCRSSAFVWFLKNLDDKLGPELENCFVNSYGLSVNTVRLFYNGYLTPLPNKHMGLRLYSYDIYYLVFPKNWELF